MRISDDAVGMTPAAAPAGLGSRIIRSLAARLDATMGVGRPPAGGTVVTLRMPLMTPHASRAAV